VLHRRRMKDRNDHRCRHSAIVSEYGEGAW
jgi:hypothetical protein